VDLCATTSQTVGPFFKIGLLWLSRSKLAEEGAAGERVTVRGRVIDGDGIPVPDAILEVWQANSHGKYAHMEDSQDKPLDNDLWGYGRIFVNAEGAFCFSTIKPGSVPGPDDKEQAPHLAITLFMRGLLRHLWTRMYFPNDSRNLADPILSLVPADRRSTLVATDSPNEPGALEWNIILQGKHETVFFELGS